MPHATMTNGDKTSSQFISHLTSYPAVNDSIETFKSNPYGKKSLELVDGAYNRFGKPVEPYLETPYSYAKPYVQKADELADSGLSRVENTFPIVKEDTNTIIDTTKSYAFWPYEYILHTYQDEYKKTVNHNNRGPGLSTSAMALVSTELKMAADFFQAVANFLGPKYEEAKKKGPDYVRDLANNAEKYAKIGQDKADEYAQVGSEKIDEAKQQGKEKTEQLQKDAQNTKENAKKTAQNTKEDAQKGAQNVKEDAQNAKEDTKKQAKDTKEDAQKKAQH